LEDRLGLEAIEAEENVNQTDIAEHEVLSLLERIPAMRIGVGPVLDGIDLRDETHRRETRRALRMIVALLPIRLPAKLCPQTVTSDGVRVHGVLAWSALDESYLVFAESLHGWLSLF
jgi:hypothetical protein